MDDATRIQQLEAELREARAENDAVRQRELSLIGEVERRDRALAEAREQQTATADVLRVIASSPTNAQPVIEAIIESAARFGASSVVRVDRRATSSGSWRAIDRADTQHFPEHVGDLLPVNPRRHDRTGAAGAPHRA